MHTAADPARSPTRSRPFRRTSWDEATLTSLRSAALDIGRLLRAIAAVAEDGDDDD